MGFPEIVRERRAQAITAVEADDGRIPIDQIRPNPDQPRREIDERSEEFEELRQSIWRHGLIQPVVVSRPDAGVDSYVLLAGERRWRAFRSMAVSDAARFSSIPAVVRDEVPEDPATNALVIGLLENVVREDLRPGDRAAAIARLRAVTEWTYEEISQHLGLGLRHVRALAAIARNDAVVEALNDGRLTQTQAKAVVNAAQGDVQMAIDLVGVVQGVPAEQTREAIRQAVVSPGMPVLHTGDGPAEAVEDSGDTIVVRETSVAAVKPRVHAMGRSEFRDMLRRALRETKGA